MKISVVTTLYRSERFLPEFYRRARAAVEELTRNYEIIFVNDASPDDSLAVAIGLSRADPHVRVVDLSRNFGHHAAIMVGLRESTGDYVFFVDSDLEEAPESLVSFYRELRSAPDTDVIYGVWRRHGEPLGRRLAADAYYTVFNFLSDVQVPRNVVMTRLMTRRFVDALMEAWQWPAPPAQLMASLGFRQTEREIERSYKGDSNYSIYSRIKITLNAIASFSSRPLHFIFLTGLFVFLLSIAAALYGILGYFYVGHSVAGWYSVFVSLWFLGGLAMMSMGVLGLYLARIFDQLRGKPLAIVKSRHIGSEPDGESEAKVGTVSARP